MASFSMSEKRPTGSLLHPGKKAHLASRSHGGWVSLPSWGPGWEETQLSVQSLPGGAAHWVCTRGRGSSQFNPMFTFFLPHPLPRSWLPLKNCLGVHVAASNGWKRHLTLVAESLEQLKPLRVPGAQASAQNGKHGRVGLCSQLQWE